MNLSGRLIQIPIMSISGLICFSIYLLITYKSGLLKELLNDPDNKLLKKLKLK